MKTEIQLSFADYWRVHVVQNLRLKRILFINFLKEKLLGRGSQYYQNYFSYHKRRHNTRLTEAELSKIVGEEVKTTNAAYIEKRRSYQFTSEARKDPNLTDPWQRGAFLCESLLEQSDLGIKSMVNVGARVDIVLSYLAGQFPDVQFTSVDFQPNLQEINATLPQSDNWSFQSGYALDLIEKGVVKGDLILFCATSVRITTRELAAYFRAAAPFAKYIAINEPWWPPINFLSSFKYLRPEEVDPESSPVGGGYGMYIHNYPGILEANGFEVVSSKMIPAVHDYHDVQIIAKNADSNIVG